MPKKFFKRIFPSPEQIQANKSLRFLAPLFAKPNLWHLNRRSVARAFLVGLFSAFIPIPFQMVLAAGIAFVANANVPISVGMVWLTNPVTIPPIYYATYKLGEWILNTPPHDFHMELSMNWVLNELGAVWQPLLVGCLTAGVVLGGTGYFLIRLFWRLHVIDSWNKRAERRRLQKHPKNTPDQDAGS